MKIEKISTIKIFFSLFFYKLAIELVYIFGISKTYSYSGLSLNENYSSYVFSIFLLYIASLISPKWKDRASTYLFLTILIFIFVPLISFSWLNGQNFIYPSAVLFSLWITSIIKYLKPLKLNIKTNISEILIKFLFLFYILVTIYLILKRGGIDSRSFNFDSIYELRAENEISGMLGYLMNWSTKVFFPFYFLYFSYIKRKELLFLTVVLQVLMFLSFGNKAFLFSIGVVILTTYLMKRGDYIKGIVISMITINLVAFLLFLSNFSDALYRAIPYRMIFIPSQIQFQYYNYFSEREKVLFSEGFIGKIFSIDNPYFEPIPILINRFYLGKEAYANTGIFADAFANGGFLAMIMISLILGLVLLLVDSISTKLPLYFVVGSSSYIMFVLNDTGLQTTLFTGGLILLIILLMLLNSSKLTVHKKWNHIDNIEIDNEM